MRATDLLDNSHESHEVVADWLEERGEPATSWRGAVPRYGYGYGYLNLRKCWGMLQSKSPEGAARRKVK